MRVLAVVLAAVLVTTFAPSIAGTRAPAPEESFGPRFEPVELLPSGESLLQDPAAFSIHVSREEDLDRELVFPAGEPSLLPKGRLRLYAEGPGLISPSLVSMINEIENSELSKAARIPVVASGLLRARVAADFPRRGRLRVHLLRAESASNGDEPVPVEMSRRVELAACESGIAMPAGMVVAALVDAGTQEFVGLSEVTRVVAGTTRDLLFGAPERGEAGLVLSLGRSSPAYSVADAEQDVELVTPDRKRWQPDLVLPTRYQQYFIWYRLPAGNMTLASAGLREGLPVRSLTLRSGRVERIEEELRPNPRLSLRPVVPPALRSVPAVIRVSDPTSDWWREVSLLEAGEEPAVVQVPPHRLELLMTVRQFGARSVADLSDGLDQEVDLDLRLVELYGTVRTDASSQPVVLFFRNEAGGRVVESTADETGTYRVVLAAGEYDLRARLRGRGREYWIGPERFENSRRFDVDIPSNHFVVIVADSESGEPVPDASVTIANEGLELQFSTVAQTDAAGEVELEPLREGKLRLQARKDGYVDSDRFEESVTVETKERSIAIPLEPEGRAIEMVLRMPNGEPAEGARLSVVPDPATVSWSGTSDASGLVRVPERFSGAMAIVTHPGSGFLPFTVTESARDLTLPAKAGVPLRIRVTNAAGEPVVSAGVLVWSLGYRLSGLALAVAAPGQNVVPPGGLFELSNAPASRLEILFYRPDAGTIELVRTGALDHKRRTVPFPWPALQTIEAE